MGKRKILQESEGDVSEEESLNQNSSNDENEANNNSKDAEWTPEGVVRKKVARLSVSAARKRLNQAKSITKKGRIQRKENTMSKRKLENMQESTMSKRKLENMQKHSLIRQFSAFVSPTETIEEDAEPFEALTTYFQGIRTAAAALNASKKPKPIMGSFQQLNKFTVAKLKEKPTRQFSCNICELKFVSSVVLRLHQLSHSEGKGYMCKQCGRTFKWMEAFHTHILSHAGVENKFHCNLCSRTFNTAIYFHKHQADHRRAVAEFPYDCEKCGRRYQSKDRYNIHLKVVCGRKNRLQRYAKKIGVPLECRQKRVCRFCSEAKCWATSSEGKEKGEGPYKCCMCSKILPSLGKYRHHKDTHNEQPYKCPVCSKMFFQPNKLQKHMSEKHVGKELYQCYECSEAFCDKAQLIEHKSVHAKQGASRRMNRSIFCSICEKRFASKLSLQKHMLIAHKSVSNKTPLKDFHECKLCGEMYSSEEKLKVHASTHKEQPQEAPKKKKYDCLFCINSFDSNKLMVAHVLKKHGEYHCLFCEKILRRKNGMKAHIQKSHKSGLTEFEEFIREVEGRTAVSEEPTSSTRTAPVFSQSTSKPLASTVPRNVQVYSQNISKCLSTTTIPQDIQVYSHSNIKSVPLTLPQKMQVYTQSHPRAVAPLLPSKLQAYSQDNSKSLDTTSLHELQVYSSLTNPRSVPSTVPHEIQVYSQSNSSSTAVPQETQIYSQAISKPIVSTLPHEMQVYSHDLSKSITSTEPQEIHMYFQNNQKSLVSAVPHEVQLYSQDNTKSMISSIHPGTQSYSQNGSKAQVPSVPQEIQVYSQSSSRSASPPLHQDILLYSKPDTPREIQVYSQNLSKPLPSTVPQEIQVYPLGNLKTTISTIAHVRQPASASNPKSLTVEIDVPGHRCFACFKIFETMAAFENHACVGFHINDVSNRAPEEQSKIPEGSSDQDDYKVGPDLFECPYCGMRYKQLYRLKIHMRSHTEEMEFKCALCSKEFCSQEMFRRHIETSHVVTRPTIEAEKVERNVEIVEMLLYCSQCRQAFANEYEFNRHECSVINYSSAVIPGPSETWKS